MMSKRQFKSQANSDRAGGAFGGFGVTGTPFGSSHSSTLSYIQEPIDYSTIDDGNLIVAFRNLSKKDSTTKAKALEDIQSACSPSDVLISDEFLEIWAKLFPRLSIDNTRRVRQISHSLNGQICSKSGKRTAKHMPRIAGPWLAGTFDLDRAAARAASDALDLVFPSEERVHAVQRTFQKPILEYCQGAILRETVGTLSDERSVNVDDANATYARVVATSLSVLQKLFKDLSEDERRKEHELYTEVFSDAKLWDFVNFSDAAVRRSMHKLVRTILQHDQAVLQDSVRSISTAYVYKGLNADQTGAALDFVQTLNELTTAHPDLWTTAYGGKKPAVSRLRHFLKQGSQQSSADYWKALDQLLRNIPQAIWPKDLEGASTLLEAARTGVSRKEERFNASTAWETYFTLANIIVSGIDDKDAESLLQQHVLPCVKRFLFPGSESDGFTITGGKPAALIAQAAKVKSFPKMLETEWTGFADELADMERLSQPEQSKDFDKSQTHVATAGERWADLQRELWTQASALSEGL